MLGITFQQLQKYEKAYNRVSCGELYEIARVFDMPAQAFFTEMSEASHENGSHHTPLQEDPIELIGIFGRLDPDIPKTFSKAAKSVGQTAGKKSDFNQKQS